MALAAGTRLGPYEVLGLIGAGGMGEVYRARDTRLDRSVAVKVLPAELASDAERRTRFEREARTISTLSHPHICTLYDVGDREGVPYLVMEHLAGETLAERLTKGPLPLDQVLDLGAQIADALSAAHRHGIVHRDLKPANVMLTATGVKLLDFGLAKLRPPEGVRLVHDSSATVTQGHDVTAAGTLVGTLPYMAPEQVEGRETDARTDLWALGCLLYEMVTGQRAFAGATTGSLVGAILAKEPEPLATRQPLTPPGLERVVKRCLAKEPDHRWDTAHDVADELRWISQSSGVTAPAGKLGPRRRRLLWASVVALGGLGLVMAGATATWLLRSPAPVALPVTRVALDVSPAEELNAGGVPDPYLPTPGGSRTALTWTPDGRALVFVGRRDGVQQLYVRRLDAAEARALAGTEGAQVPAVSGDGQWVAFWADRAIKKVPTAGGPVVEVVSGVGPPWGMAWGADGALFAGHPDRAIWEVPSQGPARAVTTAGGVVERHLLPWPLPGERVLLYTVRKRFATWGDEEVVAHRLTTGERRVLLHDAEDARYLPSGHLVFLRRGVLYGVPFDAAQLALRGAPVALLDPVAQALPAGNYNNRTGAGQFAVASTGTLAWLPGPVAPYPEASLVSVDRQGRVAALPTPVRRLAGSVRLSPDGRRLTAWTRALTAQSLWVYDLARGLGTPLVQQGEASWHVWRPDGQQLLFSWNKEGRHLLASQMADGSQPPIVLLPESPDFPSSVTPDGRQVALVGTGDIRILTLETPGKTSVVPWLQTPHNEEHAEFSPDGRWLAYTSDISGRLEVYVRPYPGPGAALQVSEAGGSSPAWHPSGRDLFFLTTRNRAVKRTMLVAAFVPGTPPRIGRPQTLFEFGEGTLSFACTPVRCFDVAPDGQRFYGIQPAAPPPRPVVTHVNLIQNWFEELKARVPAR